MYFGHSNGLVDYSKTNLQTLEYLIKYGQNTFHIDGTWHAIENGLQIVIIIVPHTSGNKITFNVKI